MVLSCSLFKIMHGQKSYGDFTKAPCNKLFEHSIMSIDIIPARMGMYFSMIAQQSWFIVNGHINCGINK